MMLKLENVCKKFNSEGDVAAVTDVSLEVAKGEFLAVIGRSGSGKSTLLGMLGGISKPTSGNVLMDNVDQWSLSDDKHSIFRNQKLGFVFQFSSLLPTLRAIDNVALPALIGGTLNYKEAYTRAQSLLNHVGLEHRTFSFPNQMSGGEQRRVAIARALINSPSVILADEPTADLDQETEDEILNLLVDIHKAFNLTMIVVTHNSVIAERADQILRMDHGRVQSIEHLSHSQIRRERSGALLDQSSEHSQNPSNQMSDFTNAPPDDELSAARERANSIFEQKEKVSIEEAIRLGEGLDRIVGRFVLTLIPIVLLIWGISTGARMYEQSVLDSKENQRVEMEDLAMKGLRADVKDVVEGPGKSYILTLYFNNTTGGEKPIFIMAPTVRGFVQVGNNWQEVAMKPADQAMPKVLKITGDHSFKYVIEPDVPNFTELLPFYMHVRIGNDMLISPSEKPKTELIERNDNYYVYLKPHGAVDSKILQKMKFPGKPPVWIPMPPH